MGYDMTSCFRKKWALSGSEARRELLRIKSQNVILFRENFFFLLVLSKALSKTDQIYVMYLFLAYHKLRIIKENEREGQDAEFCFCRMKTNKKMITTINKIFFC